MFFSGALPPNPCAGGILPPCTHPSNPTTCPMHMLMQIIYHIPNMFLEVFRLTIFIDGFLIPVKELGLLTNVGQWIRGLDAEGSYMCIVL
jgi:hypothetical protein